ncbi:MAG: Zn-dependent hydrolase [Acidimicrobiia bacterium]|nr:Zn-dependent hydrolase [Acidimicrobiia bacterium]MYC58283.1 Zn-dependent hydrolase [Acidimicrobiia bacterium]MYG93941.1 Zn-dependent hydrolase [Acidimicrobiia bacterium]MYI30010.1 Zn-dependent hydrolase [Acidimicrobiia bacterium]
MAPEISVDGRSLSDRLAALASIGEIEGTDGACRLALTDEDRAGRDLVVTWMQDLGLDISIDGIGNVIGTLAGATEGPPVMCGSHIDTVRTGGRYDGNLGVLAGLQVIEAVKQANITTRRPLAVGFFTDEEGSRFPPDMLGSLVYTGELPLEEALDIVGTDGATVGEELSRIGYRGSAPCPSPPPHAFIELHIEQGPILDTEGIVIGVVTGVQGISWAEITVAGQSNHAGTTPMNMRHDAGWAAARIAVFVHELAEKFGPPQVCTVGRVELHPNLVNVVASDAVLTVDMRNTNDNLLTEAENRLAAFLKELAAESDTEITSRCLARFAPVEFAPEMIDRVEQAAADLGLSHRQLCSGAGHDAQMFAPVCPTSMIFVPSWKGISHNPFEHTEPEHLEAGANVLARIMLDLAEIAETSKIEEAAGVQV